MTCYHPINAHVDGIRESGTKIISFADELKPGQESFLLPCGQCIGCRLDRSITWAARCMHEAQLHDENQFITLTYEIEPQDGSLNPPDFRNFLKRYRHHVTPNTLRYYHGAEYGDELQRPHHHACIFGHEFNDKEIFSECEGIITYYSPTLEKLWGHGFATISDLTLQSAAYVARYCMKKVTTAKNSLEKHYAHYEKTCQVTGEIRNLLPEYATMSRKPGIGKAWYDKYHSDIFPYDTTIYKGKNIKTPRYYENLLRSSDPSTYEHIKTTRKIHAQKYAKDNTPARLRAREKVKQLTQLQRKLHNDS